MASPVVRSWGWMKLDAVRLPDQLSMTLFPSSMPASLNLAELDDSKKLTAAKRRALARVISRVSFTGVGIATVEEIDQFNILNATFLAMQRALSMTATRMGVSQFLCLVDGNKTIPDLQQEQYPLVKGDGRSWAIAAASIVAKVVRDRYMHVLHERDPRYGFNGHKGYGTIGHRRACLSLVHQFGIARVFVGDPWMWNKRQTGQRAEAFVVQALARTAVGAGPELVMLEESLTSLHVLMTPSFSLSARSYRSYLDGAEVTVTQQKQRRVCAAAELWLMQNVNDVEDIRFDVVAVQFPKNGAPVLEHFEDAFTSPWAV